jgi:hypothetical protein
MILNGCQNAVEGQPAASSLRWSSHDYWERIKLDSFINQSFWFAPMEGTKIERIERVSHSQLWTIGFIE